RERILDLLLDGPLQRPRAVDRVEPGFAEEVACGVIERQVHVPLLQALAQVDELDVHDGADLAGAERMEHDDVIDAVDELRPEALLHDLHHGALHARVVLLPGVLLDHLRAEVRSHDDDRVRKSTVRPWPSVRRPSSNTCSRTLKTSGWAFSISSSRITA